MRLRTRLALVVALTVGPLIAGFAYYRSQARVRGAEALIAESVLLRMRHGGRERCEASPGQFREASASGSSAPVAGRGAEAEFPLLAYSAGFVSENADAPPFPTGLREALEAGDDVASLEVARERIVAVRMPWDDGPCAILLARVPSRLAAGAGPSVGGGGSSLPVGPTLILFGVVAVVLAAAGPVVGRIRRLTAQVRRSAAAGYATDVEARGTDEIADLARAFNAAAAEVREHVAALEQRDRTLREFVANTTHDVAIPLTVLQGLLTSLDRQLASGAPPDRRAVAEAMEEAHYVGSLLHNLAAAAKLEARESERHEPQPVDLNRVVERAVARHRPIAAQRGVALEFAVPETPLVVLGDVTLIEQAVSNVIHNAVRYNAPGGHVAVLLDLASTADQAPDPRRFVLRVVDDGPGVPEAELARLTERGYRSPQGRQSPGHGLGLHIASDVAARHAMTLTLERPSHGGLDVAFAGALMPVPIAPA